MLSSFSCLSGPITVDPRGSTLDSSDVCYNLLIPFISGCCCWCACPCASVCTRVCLSKTDGVGCLCLCVGNESISFTLVSSPNEYGRERAPCSCICHLSGSFLFLFFPFLSLFSHICILSLSLLVTSVTSLHFNPLSLLVFVCAFPLNFYLWLFSIILSFLISLSFTQNQF